MDLDSINRPSPSKPRYGTELPKLADGREQKRHQVTIVGAGPVGLTLALQLVRAGVECVLLEAADSVIDGSRAIGLSRRSLQILATLGLTERLMEHGLPRLGSRAFAGLRELSFRPLENNEAERFPTVLNVQQAFVEQVLVDAINEIDTDLIRWNTQVTSVEEVDGTPRLDVTTPLGVYAVEADWLIACDGGASTVRRSLGLSLNGIEYEDRYAIVDIRLPSSEYPSERRIWFDPPANRDSTIIMHKQPGGWRVDLRLRPHEDFAEVLGRGDLADRVDAHLKSIGEAGDWEMTWVSTYAAKALTLDTYRVGHVAFAGDAAHLVPIFGARGMNSGLEDACNLSWKLTHVLSDRAGLGLLDTYTFERRQAALENMHFATLGAEFVGPQSRGAEVLRRAVLSLIDNYPEVGSLVDPRTTHSIPYASSPIVMESEDEAAFRGGPVPGSVAPDVRIRISSEGHAVNSTLVDVCHGKMTILLFPDSEGATDDGLARLEGLRTRTPGLQCAIVIDHHRESIRPPGWLVVECDTDELYERMSAQPGTTYLVRPDAFIASRWLTLSSSQLQRSVDHLLQPEDARG